MDTHVLGFPRIGAHRELKHALDAYWKDELSEEELVRVGTQLRQRHWHIQKDAGLSFVATGDFSFYDHVLDTAVLLGLISERFGDASQEVNLDLYFRMARGDRRANTPALEMTKWFDTNYHYLVPEFTPDMTVRPTPLRIVEETRDAIRLGYRPKPVLLGPITFLCLGKAFGNADRWSRLDEILAGYRRVIAQLAPLCEWIQIDEPALCTDLPKAAARAFVPALRSLKEACGPARLLLATYFGGLGENLSLAADCGCDGLHLDLTRTPDPVHRIFSCLPSAMMLSVGIVDGRNVWRNDLWHSLDQIRCLSEVRGVENIMVASSCSLLHAPTDLDSETGLDPELKNWMSFAVQKCGEVGVLGRASSGQDERTALAEKPPRLPRAAPARASGMKTSAVARRTQRRICFGASALTRSAKKPRAHGLSFRVFQPPPSVRSLRPMPSATRVCAFAAAHSRRRSTSVFLKTPSANACSNRNGSAWMCLSTANRNATIWWNISANSSTASVSPKTAGYRATAAGA